jgi:Spy/CpxP family protein refolding chaperone
MQTKSVIITLFNNSIRPPDRKGFPMPLKQLFIAVSCLCLFAVIGLAQQTDSPESDPSSEVRFEKAIMEELVRRYWEGRSVSPLILDIMHDSSVRAAWDISEEQYDQFNDRVENLVSELGIAKEEEIALSKVVDGEIIETVEKVTVIAFAEDVDEETMQDLARKTMSAVDDAFNEMLAPEQWQKINESQLANMSEMPFPSPGMFEALNLTDDQRQQMAEIKKELEPEFESVLKDYVVGLFGLHDYESLEDWEKDKEIRKQKQSEVLSQAQAFSTKFKIKMFDVLTDEQWTRLQKLIDNPPEHAKIFRKKLKELSGEDENITKKDSEKKDEGKKPEMYIPGPNSWKPGDAIPEQYRQERNERQGHFPRTE